MTEFTLLVRVSGWLEGQPANLEEGPVLLLKGSVGETYRQEHKITPKEILERVAAIEEIEGDPEEELELREIYDGVVTHHVIDRKIRPGEVMYKVIDATLEPDR